MASFIDSVVVRFLSLSIPTKDGSSIDIWDPLANQTEGGKISAGSSIGDIVFSLIPIVLGFSGLILFVLLVFGGFQILTASGNQEAISKGKGMISNALIGFAIVFFAYWIMQLIQAMFGLGGLGFDAAVG